MTTDPYPTNKSCPAACIFHERAQEYDSWYDNNPLFLTELNALKSISTDLPAPRMEIGTGPGRFAEHLQVSFGIDPAYAALQRAGKRDIMGIVGVGENLPLQEDRFGTLYLLFTLCFLKDPGRVLKECHRVLQSHGRLVIGMIPANSELGNTLIAKRKKGNPFYTHARFYTVAETMSILENTGFTLLESRSVQLSSNDTDTAQTSRPGMDEQAGFCILVSAKEKIS